MKGHHSNGVRGLSSPERGASAHDKRCTANNYNHHSNNNAAATVTAPTNNHNNKNNNTHHPHQGGGSGGGSGSSDSRKGGSSSGGSEAIPVVWPPKFVIGLTNKEKEEDFMAIKGSKLPHRPKKRAKFIQRTLSLVSPGAWLCDLTLERYEIREKKITKKITRADPKRRVKRTAAAQPKASDGEIDPADDIGLGAGASAAMEVSTSENTVANTAAREISEARDWETTAISLSFLESI